jgi:hypothetical protein
MDEEKRGSLRNGWKRAIHAAQIWAQDDRLYME